ncbi:MAG: DUF5666 domain-containing protein [Caldilineaceae bacterium]
MKNTNKRFKVNIQQARPWLLMLALIGMLILGQTATPTMAAPTNQTVPQPKPEQPDLPTVLVGPIDSISLDARTLVVAGVPISMTDDTRISGRVGDLTDVGWARVVGQADGQGGIVADRIKGIKAKPFIKLRGQLDELTDTSASVNAIGLSRTETTMLVGDPQIGDRVKVRAAIDTNNNRLALQIHKIGPKPAEPEDDNEQDEDGDELDDVEQNQRTRLIGVVQALPDTGLQGEWVVSTVRVNVTADTKVSRLHRLLTEDAWVQVDGEMNADGVLEAKHLHVIRTRHYHKLGGVLDSMSDTEIVVNGIPVQLGENVRIKGDPQVGNWVHVYMTLGDDNVLTAVKLVGRHNHGSNPQPDQPSAGDVINFMGIVNELPIGTLYGDWKVNGVILTVPDTALIDEHKGAVAVGALVSVKATVEINNGATFTAIEIVVVQSGGSTTLPPQQGEEGEFVEFDGVVEGLPGANSDPGGASWDGGEYVGDWTVSGRTVHVSEQTRVEAHGGIQVGDEVEVKGYELSDGSIRATKVEAKGNHEGGGGGDGEHHGDRKEFMGKIVSFPDGLVGDWTVNEFTFKTTDTTVFVQELAQFEVGAKVVVWAEKGQDGMWTAYKVKAVRAPE